MIKHVEYEDAGNWYKGAIEVSERIENGKKLYIIKSFLEDLPYGADWNNVTEDNLEAILSTTEKGLRKALKIKADQNNNTVEDRLKRKGFSTF